MRWKLVILASIIAATATISVIHLIANLLSVQIRAVVILPILLITSSYTAYFIYRHTAKRRKLQAVVTISLTILLTLGILFAIVAAFPNL